MIRTKYIALILIHVCVGHFASIAQCSYPAEQSKVDAFRTEFSAIRNPRMQMERATEFTRSNCLLSRQVRDIAIDFSSDDLRIEYTRIAYPLVYDPVNFLIVMDAFNNLSAAFTLYDFIRGNSSSILYSDPQSTEPTLQYPSCVNYNGNMGCSSPLPPSEYQTKYTHVAALTGNSAKLNAMKTLTSISCLTTEQVMRFCALLELERARLDFLKYALDYTYDLDNYHETARLLTLPEYKQDLLRLLGPISSSSNSGIPGCAVSETDFRTHKDAIKNQSFKSTKITLAKQIIKDRCFTSAQLKDILNLFSFESSKMEIAKYAYEFTLDKQNYFVINDVFSYASSVSELDNFINSKK